MTRAPAPDLPASDPAPSPERAGAGRHGPSEPELVWTAVELAAWRARAYRLFATLFLYPGQQRLLKLIAASGELRSYDEALSALPLFAAWHRLLALLEALDPQQATELQTEHVRLFSVNPAGMPCVPFESDYVAPGQANWVAIQLGRAYAREGLGLAPSQNESPDHASVELEFMAYLCQQEAEAWRARDLARGLRLLAGQRSFLRAHLHRWFGTFALRVQAEAALPLYVAAAEAADAFVYHDLDLVGSLIRTVRLLPSQTAAGPTRQVIEDG